MHSVTNAMKHPSFGSLAPDRSPRRGCRRVGVALIAACAALTLTGCAGFGSDYAVLDREPDASDGVPELPSYAWHTADPATARFVAEHDETSLWLMRADDDAVCLLAYVDSDTWILGCGGSGASSFGVGGAAGSFTVVPDGMPSPEGMAQLSENVFTSTAE